MIAKGVNIDAQDKDQLTPLHWAASGGCTEIVELLVTNGADVNAKTVQGQTPLQLATIYKRDEVVKILSAKVVVASDVLSAGQNGTIKLMFAAVRAGKTADLQVPLAAGASIPHERRVLDRSVAPCRTMAGHSFERVNQVSAACC